MVDAALNGSDDEGALTPILQADIAKNNMPETAKSFLIGFIVFSKGVIYLVQMELMVIVARGETPTSL